MFKFLVSDLEDWAGKFGLSLLLSGEIVYAYIRRNYACLYREKLCMSVSGKLCIPVSEEIVYVCIGRNHICSYQKKLYMAVSEEIVYVCIGRDTISREAPARKTRFLPLPWFGVRRPYKIGTSPALQIDINQSYIIY